MLKKNQAILLKTVVSLGLLSWLVYTIDWPQLRHVLEEARITWLLPAILLIFLSMYLSTVKWQVLLRAQGFKTIFRDLWMTYWIGIFANNFLPSSIGGDSIRIIITGKRLGDMAGAAASITVERILATFGLAVTGVLASSFARQMSLQVNGLFIVLIIVSSGLTLLIALASPPGFLLKKKGRCARFLVGLCQHGGSLKEHWRKVFLVGALSVLFQLTVVGVNYTIFRALNITELSFIEVIYIIPAISALSMIPLGINGYGVREGAYVFLLSTYGVDKGPAFAASLIFAFLVSFCSLYGGWLWLIHRRKDRECSVGENC